MIRVSHACFSLLLLILCLSIGTPLHAEEDIVQFGNTIRVGPDVTAHDTVCFFCSINIEGSVNGDAVAFFGSVHVDGHANHDVVVFFGDTRVADDSSVGQDLVNFFGTVRLGNNASVGHNLVSMFGSLHQAASATISGDRVAQPGWIFWVPFLIIFGGIAFVTSEYRSYHRRRRLRGY